MVGTESGGREKVRLESESKMMGQGMKYVSRFTVFVDLRGMRVM